MAGTPIATAALGGGWSARHRRRLLLVLCITRSVVGVHVVEGGAAVGALALSADAGHMLPDAAGGGIGPAGQPHRHAPGDGLPQLWLAAPGLLHVAGARAGGSGWFVQRPRSVARAVMREGAVGRSVVFGKAGG